MGVSITTPEIVDSGVEVIAALRSGTDGVPILAGGLAIADEAHARALGADGWAPDGRAVVALLDVVAGGPGGSVR